MQQQLYSYSYVPGRAAYGGAGEGALSCWVWSVTEQTLPPETAASSSDQARNKPRNNQQDQRRVHLSWRHNTWSETRSLCLLNSFERALPNAASSLCFLQCCTVRLPGAAAVVFFISLIDHFLSLFFFFFFFLILATFILWNVCWRRRISKYYWKCNIWLSLRDELWSKPSPQQWT